MKTSMYDNKQNVAELQTALRHMHAMGTTIPLINPDGFFGPETTAAVVAAQRFFSIPDTGVVDFETWTLIFSDYLDFLSRSIFI